MELDRTKTYFLERTGPSTELLTTGQRYIAEWNADRRRWLVFSLSTHNDVYSAPAENNMLTNSLYWRITDTMDGQDSSDSLPCIEPNVTLIDGEKASKWSNEALTDFIAGLRKELNECRAQQDAVAAKIAGLLTELNSRITD